MPLPPKHLIRHFVERLFSIRYTSRLWSISDDELAYIVQTETKMTAEEWEELLIDTQKARIAGAQLATQQEWGKAVIELEQAAVFYAKDIPTLEALAEAYRRWWNTSHQLEHRQRALDITVWCLFVAPKSITASKIQKELHKDSIFMVRMSQWFGYREPFFDFKKWLHELEQNRASLQNHLTTQTTISDWEAYLENKIQPETEQHELQKRTIFIHKLQLPQNTTNEQAFIIALQKMDYDAIHFFAILLKHKLNDPIIKGISPLNYALLHLDFKITNILLKAGANPNNIDQHTNLPLLCLPIEVDDVALVQLLLSNNADPNFNKHSISPITYAIEQGKMTIIRLLIEAGAILEAEQIRNPTVKLILQEIAMNRKKE